MKVYLLIYTTNHSPTADFNKRSLKLYNRSNHQVDPRKQDLIDELWDLFKALHGVRPRGMNYATWSLTDLEHEVDRLQLCLEEDIRWEREQEDRAINACMDVGASDIGTAMRWLEEAYDMEWV